MATEANAGTSAGSGALLPQHAAMLSASAIAPEIAEARGYRSVTTRSELRRLGFSDRQARVPALLIPIRGVHGDIALYQARPDEPRIERGKAVKYETPRGAHMALDVHPSARPKLADPKVPLFITEGVRKADSAISKGLCCVALLGVWNFRGTNEHGGKTAIADWESIALNGRETYIVFDSDVMTKSEVGAALERLEAFLGSRGADVRLVYLPSGPGGTKVGLDDFMAAGKGVDDLFALATKERRTAIDDSPRMDVPYLEVEGGLFWLKPTKDDVTLVPLTNFTATITDQIVEDDGVERHRLFELETRAAGHSRIFRLASAVFERMAWAAEQLGSSAVIYAGFGARDHTRAAIQLLSGEVPERTVYTHLGWREIDGAWVYLHAGGAIGTVGTVGTVAGGIETRLDDALARYVLPDPPEGSALVDAVRASLALLDLAPDRISVPLLAAAYRAVLGQTDYSLHLTGATGVFKTELVALVLQHFGAGMDARHLPATWSSTANALEAIAFAAKDALLVIDDFAPTGLTGDVQQLHRDADRVLRAQGNVTGRQRMRADTTLRPAKPPRGLILSTGEDVPRGQSLRGRMLIIEIAHGDIEPEVLSARQRDAAAGRYAAAMSGFIHRLSVRYGEISEGLRVEVQRLRDAAIDSPAHRRTPEIVASLAFAMDHFLDLAVAVGAIDAEERTTLMSRVWSALGEAAAGQAEHQSSSDPARRFLELLGSAISAGRAHVAAADGALPADPLAWGWRKDVERTGAIGSDWRAQRECVGWIVDEDLYLDPDASYAVAQAMGRDTGEPLAVQPRTLRRRLHGAGFLASTEAERERLTVRRMLGGVRRDVLHLDASILHGPSQPSQPSHDDLARPPDQDRSGSEPRESPVVPDGPVAIPWPDAAPDEASDASDWETI